MRGVLKLASVKRSTPAMAAALPGLPMAETVVVRLTQILQSSMRARFEPMFHKVGFTEGAFHVLCLLLSAEDGRAAPGELSELMGTSKSNLTRILERMKRDGLIRRHIESADARRHAIEATDKGRRMAVSAVPGFEASLRAAFSGLNADELATLTTLMSKAILSLDTAGITLQSTEGERRRSDQGAP